MKDIMNQYVERSRFIRLADQCGSKVAFSTSSRALLCSLVLVPRIWLPHGGLVQASFRVPFSMD